MPAPRSSPAASEEIDKDLRAEIRRLQGNRKRIARLAAGEHLALPDSVVDYLDRLRGLGVDERYIELERGSWIMIAAQVPDQIDAIIANKHEELDDPDTVKLYRLLSEAVDWPADDPRIVEIADILERLMIRAVEAGEVGTDPFDDPFVDLLDATAVESSPVAERLLEILQERGWKGWTRIERVPKTSIREPMITVRSRGRPKYSAASAVMRERGEEQALAPARSCRARRRRAARSSERK